MMFAILRAECSGSHRRAANQVLAFALGERVGTGRASVRVRGWIVAPLLTALATALVGCGSAGDLLNRDAEWFNRPSRIFTNATQIETPPLTEQKPIAPDDLISAEGYCSGMAAPSDANALTETVAPAANAASAPAGIALGRSECEVARYAGLPDNVEISNDPRGDRTAVLTYLKGPRPGIYRFIAGRLSSVDRAPVPETPTKPARTKKRTA